MINKILGTKDPTILQIISKILVKLVQPSNIDLIFNTSFQIYMGIEPSGEGRTIFMLLFEIINQS